MNYLKTLLFSAAALSLTLIPATGMAWSAQGHRLVAEIAVPLLTPDVKEQVDQLLAQERKGTLPSIASWADELRSSDPDLGRRAANWHFINMAEDGCNYSPERHCPDGNCVIEALRAQTLILADTSKPQADRTQALKFVVHLVGDLHQPMHAGFGHDRGGNRHQLQFKRRGTNLHALWDGGMLTERRRNDRQYRKRLQALPAPEQSTVYDINAPVSWTEETCRIATQDGVYPPTREIDHSYVERFLPVAEGQLRLAGERLAQLLNSTLQAPAAD